MLRRLELNGGQVSGEETLQLLLPPTGQGYADAQIDDYGLASGRKEYRWRPGTRLSLRARFSHDADGLRGTAGFGFWNAPFGDPTVRWPALPQAAWFFFASRPSDLPFAVEGPGRGWFVATIDAGHRDVLSMMPLAPLILLLNQSPRMYARLWPHLRRRLQIGFAPVNQLMTSWHAYELRWKPQGCTFAVDGEAVLQARCSPRGPLGFVCWVDNQYMVATAHGRFRWGVLSTTAAQWMEVANLELAEL
jgi:hypothetical protein